MRENWKKELLKNICEVFSDGNWIESKDQSSKGIRLVQTGNIGFGYFRNKKKRARYISEDTFVRLKCTEILPGDLLVSRLPDPVGKSCIIPDLETKMITGVDCTIIRPKHYLASEYLGYYQMSNQYLRDVESRVSGTTRSRISRKNLGLIEIPIPPLPEQKQIVALLDQAFAAIDQAKANIETNIENAKELFQSKLNAIFSQRGEGWEEKKLKDITSKIGSGATPRGGQSSYKKYGISLIRSMNVYDKGFKPKKLAFIDKAQAEKLKNVKVEEDDVLLNITGASVARCCIVNKEYLPARVNQHVSIIRIKNDILNPSLLHYGLTSKANKDLLLGIGEQGSTRQAITKVQLENFKIRYPKEIKFQNHLVNELNDIRQKILKLESQYEIKLASLEELKKSILQKAFSGELTEKSAVGSPETSGVGSKN